MVVVAVGVVTWCSDGKGGEVMVVVAVVLVVAKVHGGVGDCGSGESRGRGESGCVMVVALQVMVEMVVV